MQVLFFQLDSKGSYYRDKLGAKLETFRLDRSIFGSYCLSLFSAVNQFSVVNVLGEYKNPTERRVNKVRQPLLAYIPVPIHPLARLFLGGDCWLPKKRKHEP